MRSPPNVRRTQGVLGGRSERVVGRVLAAALAELAHSGYTAFRMEAVATAAAVNKTTIYRRWPTRKALVTALVEQMRAPLRQRPLPDTGKLESDLVQAFTRRASLGGKVDGRAWSRLLEERHNAEVEAIVGAVVSERAAEWLAIVQRGIARGELPPKTNARLLLHLVRAVADSRPSPRLHPGWLTIGVRTILAGARSGTLVRGA